MSDRYDLAIKFLVIAAILNEKDAKTDFEEFIKIKKIRDRFYHGKPIDENRLPIKETQTLFCKYLSYHLEN